VWVSGGRRALQDFTGRAKWLQEDEAGQASGRKREEDERRKDD